jgi:hypothetical protein
VAALDVARYGVVHAVAGHTHGLAGDHAEHRDDRRLRAPPADVDDHVAAGRVDRQIGADGRGDRLGHELRRMAAAGLLGGVADGALLDAGDASGDADHHLGLDEAQPRDRLGDEVAQHGLCHKVVGDDAVPHRPDDGDAAGRSAHHVPGVVADGDDGVVTLGDGDDGWLVNDDALALLVNEHVRGTEIDPDLLTESHEKWLLGLDALDVCAQGAELLVESPITAIEM